VNLPKTSNETWKACAPLVALAAALFAGYFLALRPRIDPTGTVLVSTLATFGALAIIGGLAMLVRSWPDAWALTRAGAGKPPRDGRLEAFAGSLEPEGTPLEGPFTGSPCSLYEYGVEPADGAGSDYFGIGLTPSVIRGSRGSARLLGFPTLDHLPRALVKDPELRQRAERYLAGTGSERLPTTPNSVAGLIGDFLEAAADDDGAVRRDWRRVEFGPLCEDDVVYERSLAPEASVTALGLYSAERAGLMGGGNPVQIVLGDLETARTRLVTGSRRYALAGIIWGLLLQAFFVTVWTLARGV